MEHFWLKFQEWTSNNYKHASGTTTSAWTEFHNDNVPGTTSTQLTNKRNSNDEPTEGGGDNSRAPKRPRNKTKVRQERNKALDFACHFKKHNPRKYNIDEFRSCCLGHWGTIARVKEHLYRRHQLAPQCPRCCQQFESQEELQAHSRLAVSCELQPCREQEGITADVEKQLKSRKKTSAGQSEADRWREIYQILFPGEPVPSPYNYENWSASRDFLNYVAFAREEVPRRFRQSLEAIITAGIEPIEHQIIARMEDLIRDCQEQTFSSYRLQYRSAEQTVPVNTGHLNLGDEKLPQHQPAQEEMLTDVNTAAPPQDRDPPEDVGPVDLNSEAQDMTQYESGVTLSVASNDPPDAQGTATVSHSGNDTDWLMCGCSYFCICPRNSANQRLTSSQIHVTPGTPMNLDIEPTIATTEKAMSGYTSQLLVESNDDGFDWASYLNSC
ncbi:uncharacterized protein K444DRAFT_541329 [Hyaloscypha bicolor E]|uniref:C2H2-type domain-containing protein n=1 Tax=Hyaloscypha bicolor E TaxID=1095630 RepID=A0A2J6SS31_9HELO|nr:uncharacterized protein K444DRAFT_541329 [Hyaloscypha bicolor E]PMD53503.1 hypothetical protein K444DRAFT_541329 [Hyaloscypha bicolor E]